MAGERVGLVCGVQIGSFGWLASDLGVCAGSCGVEVWLGRWRTRARARILCFAWSGGFGCGRGCATRDFAFPDHESTLHARGIAHKRLVESVFGRFGLRGVRNASFSVFGTSARGSVEVPDGTWASNPALGARPPRGRSRSGGVERSLANKSSIYL